MADVLGENSLFRAKVADITSKMDDLKLAVNVGKVADDGLKSSILYQNSRHKAKLTDIRSKVTVV